MAFGFGSQEMLDRAQVPDKWQLTPLRNFKSPRIRARMWRTALAVLITAVVYEYLLSKRNPCFALIGADSAIQPGSVIYFVVIYTVGTERVLPYTIARILDTGGGVLIALLLYVLFPSKHDREKGVSLLTFWAGTKDAFKSYINKNRTSRKKERENFGAEDENFFTIISKIKDRRK
ncbi:hypothetical protein [Blautia sp. AF19-10LB]|uniref:hypothetical protein n=1 Tax=Blautia sp. AF19-10LB TaxID=2292961 RepID=UPI000E544B23|nr:hypothetical protein [Blautia sp. AF19-10LB]RGG60087.1 hypothetical protein DWX28_14090 [Blautia sp. AF19-10LB]